MQTFFNVVEYALSGIFFWAAVTVLSKDPSILPGLLMLLVGQGAIYVYSFMFLSVGALLLYSKLRKDKVLHRYSLMLMYLVCIYFFLISVAVHGLTVDLILVVVVGIVSAAMWLRWKFKTEYLDPKQFEKDLKMHE